MRPIGTKPQIFMHDKFIVVKYCRMSGSEFFKDELVVVNDFPSCDNKGIYFSYIKNRELITKGSMNFREDIFRGTPRLRYPYKNELKFIKGDIYGK